MRPSCFDRFKRYFQFKFAMGNEKVKFEKSLKACFI